MESDHYREALRRMPDGLYPKALHRIRRGTGCRLSAGGWRAWAIWPRHGHPPLRVDGYAAEDCEAGEFVRLLPVPERL